MTLLSPHVHVITSAFLLSGEGIVKRMYTQRDEYIIYYMIYSSLDKFIIVETTTLHLSIWPKGINLFTLGISTSSRVSAVHSIDHWSK